MEKLKEEQAVIAPQPRKIPVQARSRERYERMLEAATAIIGETGSEAMRMSEIAERAGVPIGSLYQFFPDKVAIVGALAERVNAEGRRCIQDGLVGVDDRASLERAFAALLDTYYALFLERPAMRDIWSAMQSDKTLRAMQLAESFHNADLVTESLKRLSPDASEASLRRTALLVMHLGDEAMRLAISLDREEGGLIIEEYKAMSIGALLRAVAP